MRNKSKLKGGIICIEHDLTWEERKVQEKIGRWVRAERDRGKEVKTGYARMRIEGRWVRWEDIEQGLISGGEEGGEEERASSSRDRERGEEGSKQMQGTSRQDLQH